MCDMSCPQVYIGHSEPVQAVAFTPDQRQLLSVGDAIFLWDILALPERSPPGRQVSALDLHLPGCLLHPSHPIPSLFASAVTEAHLEPPRPMRLVSGPTTMADL